MSNLKKTFAQLGKKLDETISKVEPVIKKGKERVYNAAAHIENDLNEEKTVLGGLAKTVSKTASTVGKKAKSLHEKVKSQGGYLKALDEKLEASGKRIDDYFNNLERTIEREFYTEGTFDCKKAKQFLSREAEVVRVYGEKFIRRVSTAVETGKDSIIRDYRSYIPSKEELQTRYSNIGTSYNGILMRDDFESCLKFYNRANEILPKSLMYRNQILSDIKISASANKKELFNYYSSLEEKDPALKRRYLVAKKVL